jgi:hypothetical protein
LALEYLRGVMLHCPMNTQPKATNATTATNTPTAKSVESWRLLTHAECPVRRGNASTIASAELRLFRQSTILSACYSGDRPSVTRRS